LGDDQVSWTKTRSEIAHAKRANPDADITPLRQKLKAERLEEYIRRVVDEAPPLTNDQRERLALLLRGSTPNGGAGA
jgi:hypothetical protein